MKDSIIQRIKQVVKEKAKNDSEFCFITSINQNTFSQQLRGLRSVSFDTVSKILSAFEDISSEWLLRGKGEMINPQHEPATEPQPAPVITTSECFEASSTHQPESTNVNIYSQEEQIESKNTIEVLIKVIETYQNRVDDLLNVVESLKNENANLKSQLEKRKTR